MLTAAQLAREAAGAGFRPESLEKVARAHMAVATVELGELGESRPMEDS